MSAKMQVHGNSLRRLTNSNDFNQMRGEPDFELLKTGLEALFELDEKLPVFGVIRHVHKHAKQSVAEDFTLVLPESVDDLSLAGNRSKPPPQLQESNSFGTRLPSLNCDGMRIS